MNETTNKQLSEIDRDAVNFWIEILDRMTAEQLVKVMVGITSRLKAKLEAQPQASSSATVNLQDAQTAVSSLQGQSANESI